MKSKQQGGHKNAMYHADDHEDYGKSKTKKGKRKKQLTYDEIMNQGKFWKRNNNILQEQFFDDDEY